MDIAELKQNSSSLLPRIELDSHKLGLDLKKSQTLGLLPSTPDFVLSGSLLNKIAESQYLTTDVVQNYQDRIKEFEENFGIDEKEEEPIVSNPPQTNIDFLI